MTRATASNDLKNQLAQRAQNAPQTQQSDVKTIDHLLKRLAPQIQRALPKHMTADRLARIALTTIRTNPKLLECTPESLMAAVMQSAQLGLEPGILGHAYFVPFKNGKTGRTDVQFQIGYKGLLELVRRSGEVTSIAAHEVYENDFFEFEYGIDEKLTHRPNISGDRGEVYAYYAYAKYKDGGHSFLVMSKKDILEYAKKYSKAYYKGQFSGPWATDFDAMAKKTVLKQLMKYMPLSIELQRQLSTDETVKMEIEEDMTEVTPVDIVIEHEPIDEQMQAAQEELERVQMETAATGEQETLL
jgi:recombination protein RecT